MTIDIEIFKRLNVKIVPGIIVFNTMSDSERNSGRSPSLETWNTKSDIVNKIVKNLSGEFCNGAGWYEDLIINLNEGEFSHYRMWEYIKFKNNQSTVPPSKIIDFLSKNNICVIRIGPDLFHKISYGFCEYAFHIVGEKVLISTVCRRTKNMEIPNELRLKVC